MGFFAVEIQLLELDNHQVIATALVFVWSGFTRSGLGFGGAALSLPLLLFISDRPLFWLPILGMHLLFFSALTLRNRLVHVDWAALKQNSIYIFPTKLIGVFGLVNLPNLWLVVIIYLITMFYALLWMLNLNIRSEKGWTDKLLLAIGGYFSGTSLTGAPLIAAVFAHSTSREKLRDTLFVLWFIMVSIKILTLIFFDVDLQVTSMLCLIPVAALGHFAGLKVHQYILGNDLLFKRVIGSVLIAICAIGLGGLVR